MTLKSTSMRAPKMKKWRKKDQNMTMNSKNVLFCNELVNHSKHNLKTCSNCDFSTKCWAEDWNETPAHIFSTADLRDMGYKI